MSAPDSKFRETKSSAERQHAGASTAAETLLTGMASGIYPKAVQSIARMHSEVFDAWMTCNLELMDFYKGRYQQDRALAKAVTQCANPSEAIGVCMDFWGRAMTDYSGEAGKLANLNSELAAETVKRISEEANVISRDFATERQTAA